MTETQSHRKAVAGDPALVSGPRATRPLRGHFSGEYGGLHTVTSVLQKSKPGAQRHGKERQIPRPAERNGGACACLHVCVVSERALRAHAHWALGMARAGLSARVRTCGRHGSYSAVRRKGSPSSEASELRARRAGALAHWAHRLPAPRPPRGARTCGSPACAPRTCCPRCTCRGGRPGRAGSRLCT